MSFGNHQRCTVARCRFFILKDVFLQNQPFGQTIATSHHLAPNGGLEREVPLFQGNLGLVKYDNLASNHATTVVFVSPDVSLPVTLIPQSHCVLFPRKVAILENLRRYRPVTWHQKTCSSGSKEVIGTTWVFLGNSYATDLFPGYLDVVDDAFAVG